MGRIDCVKLAVRERQSADVRLLEMICSAPRLQGFFGLHETSRREINPRVSIAVAEQVDWGISAAAAIQKVQGTAYVSEFRLYSLDEPSPHFLADRSVLAYPINIDIHQLTTIGITLPAKLIVVLAF